MPVAGEITGVAACDCALIVITEVAVALCVNPEAVAMASTVVEEFTVNELVYNVEDVVGWLPSVV